MSLMDILQKLCLAIIHADDDAVWYMALKFHDTQNELYSIQTGCSALRVHDTHA